MDAASLVREMSNEMKDLEETLRVHAYPAKVAEGSIGKTALQKFAGEQFHIIRSDLRSVAALVTRFGALPSREYFWNILQGEKAALEALKALAAALGVSENWLDSYDPTPKGQAYTAYLAWLGSYGGQGQVAAALLVNFPAWGYNCGRMSSALKSRHGLKDSEVAFFDLFASPPPDLEESGLAVIAAGLAAGETPLEIKRAARLLQAYELMFWDGMLEIALPSSR
ncbi:MAG: transcriptional regulator [Candidatus Tectomicrobia bacterium]|uniref:Transcriptional regulator n=1 Tax=Tectimicrobiota bacterium TaxID=2528274 RepID=A0A932GS52_UNCTE|nr:transcriptional regulator [Candidatus Tectomicrobia bacterium]